MYPEAGRGQRQPPPNQQQAPQANVVLVEMSVLEQSQAKSRDQGVEPKMKHVQLDKISAGCDVRCDCSSCIKIEECEDVQALAVTRAKGKAIMQWDEQEKVGE